VTKNTFNSMMNFLKNSKGTLISDARVLTYWQVLNEYSNMYVKKATFNCVKKYDFFPTISQIVREFENCEEDERRKGSYIKKIGAPRNMDSGSKWARQARIFLSCKKNQNLNYNRLYTKEELKIIVEKGGGDKKLLFKQDDNEVEIDTVTGEIIEEQEGEIICQEK